MSPVATVRLKDGRQVKLGRIRPKVLPPVLRFKHYLAFSKATPPPSVVDYSPKAMQSVKRTYLNDRYGDCVIAGKYHQLGIWSGNDTDSGGVVLADDREVLDAYHRICGPGDNGCVITDVLDVFQQKGLTASGKTYKIDGYVAIDNTNKLEVQVALFLFGSLTLGIDLPGAWADAGEGELWDVTRSGIVGGHDVCAIGYDDVGVTICTWGGLRKITWAAFMSKQWITECYAELAPLWYNSDKLAPCGVNVSQLQIDLSKLQNGIIPEIDPTPVPPGPVPPGPTPSEVSCSFEQNVSAGKYMLVPSIDPGNDPRYAINIGQIFQAFGILVAFFRKKNITLQDLIELVTALAAVFGVPIPPFQGALGYAAAIEQEQKLAHR